MRIAEEMEDFERLLVECEPMGLSPADVSVLFLAMREGAILLSGDKPLRNQAKLRFVETHGTLWIMDQLVDSGILPKRVAVQRLETMLSRTGREQRYLAKGECHMRITRWNKG